MKKATFALILVGLLALGGSAFAEICAIDSVPAATLLLPYFEVDLDGGPEGFTTLFSVNNASAAATIAHVILWTNWSEPTIDFDIFLTGYDVQTVNLRDVFNGTLPITLHEREDVGDVVSPHQGDFANNPQWDSGLAFAGCDPLLPYPDPVVTGGTLTRLVNGHIGQPIPGIGCLGADLGDNIARGYITFDDARDCSLVLDPGDPGYFIEGGSGIATNENQLWGDYFYVDLANNFAQGESMVHVEADPLFEGIPEVGLGGDYTFYGRYTLGSDDREPLGTSWAARYLSGNEDFAAFDGTDFIVWRDSTSSVIANGWNCGNFGFGVNGPPWFPLQEEEVVAFDEAEDAVQLCFLEEGTISPGTIENPACFPYETGRYPIGPRPHPYEGSPNPLDPPFQFGWMFLNLNLNDAFAGDVDFGPLSGGVVAQSYVSVLHQAEGRFSVGLEAVELTDACDDVNPTIVGLPTTTFIPEVAGGIN